MNGLQTLYSWGGVNEWLFHFINGAATQSFSLPVQLLDVAGGYWAAPAVMCGLWLLARRSDNERQAKSITDTLMVLAFAYGASLLIVSLLKVTFALPRPSLVIGEAVQLIGEADSRYGFPSGHATFSALVTSTLWPLAIKRLRWILIAYLVLVGWSRIAAGMHFPADVVAGWIVGFVSVAIARKAHLWRSARAPLAWPWIALAIFILMLDQLAKGVVSDQMAFLETRAITPFLNLVHVLNPGAAFSFLAGAGGWQRYFFIAIAWLACGWLIALLSRPRPQIEATGFSLILGGALSNALDRALRGPVVDYLDFHWKAWHWPAFNIADIAICIGAGLILFFSFKVHEQPSFQNQGGVNANN